MKNSGVEWIGEIPDDWEVRKVKHAFIRKNEKAMQDNPVVLSLARSGVRERDISNNEGQLAESYFNYNPVDIDDLLLNPMDLYSGANCSISKVKGVISPAYVNLRAKKNVSPFFYDYYFKVQYWLMAFFAHGNGVSFENRWTLNNETLKNYPIVYPNFETQQKIAAYLDSKCSKIEETIQNQQQVIEKLKAYKQSLITEAVTGKIKIQNGKACGTYEEYKDSGVEWIGEIPNGWIVQKLNRFIKTVKGFAFSVNDFEDEGLPIVKVSDIKNGKIQVGDSFLNEKRRNDFQKVLLHTNDILMTTVGSTPDVINSAVGQLAIVTEDFNNAFLNQNAVKLYSENNNNIYIYYCLCMKAFREHLNLIAHGTANQASLTLKDILAFSIQLPSKEEQKSIAEYLNKKCTTIDTTIEQKQKLIEKLTEYKKSLIYECVTGKKAI